MDLDRDNIVCEVVRPKPAVTPTPAPTATAAPTPSAPPAPANPFAQFKLGIQGLNRVGQTLTAHYFIPEGYRFIGVQWLVSNQMLAGFTARSIVAPSSLEGQSVAFDLIVADPTGKTIFPRSSELAPGVLGTATSDLPTSSPGVTQTPASGPPSTSSDAGFFRLGMSGLNKPGERMIARFFIPPGYEFMGVQWLADRQRLQGMHQAGVFLPSGVEGKRLSFDLMVRDAENRGRTVRSAEIEPGAQANDLPVDPPTSSSTISPWANPTPPKPLPPRPASINQTAVSSEICKIQENSRIRKPGAPTPDFQGERDIMGRYPGNATAFPFAPTALNVKGELNVAFIYVDWADLPGVQSDYDYYAHQVQMFKDFYWMASEHKLNMKVNKTPSWHRIEGSYKDFTLNFDQEAQQGFTPRKQAFYDAAAKASDPHVDFTDVDIVFFAIPRAKSVFYHGGPHEFNFLWNSSLKTNEGTIYDIASAGDWFLANHWVEPPWVYYVHEVGHMIGIPHQSNEDFKDGSQIVVNNPLNGYDIMANQGGASRTLTAWLRWLAGWLDDSQVACVTKESITENFFEIEPINRVSGKLESVVIRLSSTKVVVIESRRFDPQFDRLTRNSKNGLIAYVVDATKATAQGNQALLSPRDINKYLDEPTWRSGQELDAIFFQGDYVVIEGIRIEAHTIGETADIIRLSRVAG